MLAKEMMKGTVKLVTKVRNINNQHVQKFKGLTQ